MSVPAPIYHTLSADTISKKMFDIVNEVNVVFQLPMPYVRLLLIACKWDKEKLLERSVPTQMKSYLTSHDHPTRYYAGDQEALFKEAHVVPPQRRQSEAEGKLEVRVGHCLHTTACLPSFARSFRHSQLLHVEQLHCQDKSSSAIYVCSPMTLRWVLKPTSSSQCHYNSPPGHVWPGVRPLLLSRVLGLISQSDGHV